MNNMNTIDTYPQVPQSPHFASIPRFHKTENELNAAVAVVKVGVYGKYTKRGDHRKEVIEADFEAIVEVPATFNKGHLKLVANRYVRKTLKGIRVRTFYLDEEVQVEKLDHKRRVRDFMSDKGLRDNNRLHRTYDRAIAQRQAEANSLAGGIAPSGLTDNTQYSGDGLMPNNGKYVDV